jgi:hypothetical protein
MSETLKNILETYGQEQGHGPLKLDRYGRCVLALENDLVVHIFLEPDKKSLRILADIGPMPSQIQAAEVYESLLIGNYQSRPEQEGLLTMEPESGRILLLFTWSQEKGDAQTFAWFMQTVQTNSNFWREKYAAIRQDEDDPFGVWPLMEGELWGDNL